MDEYLYKLSSILDIKTSDIEIVTDTSVLSSKDLYDFYLMTGRFPTKNEIETANKFGVENLFLLYKCNILKVENVKDFI